MALLENACPAYRCSKSFPSKTTRQCFCAGPVCQGDSATQGGARLWRFLISNHSLAFFLLSAFRPPLSELTLNKMDIPSSINKIKMKMQLGREGKTMTLTHHQTFHQDHGLGVRQSSAHSLSTLNLCFLISKPGNLSTPTPAGYDEADPPGCLQDAKPALSFLPLEAGPCMAKHPLLRRTQYSPNRLLGLRGASGWQSIPIVFHFIY